ncbi:MAG: MFS transporter, partial [Pseudomonadota bacterium]
WRLWTNAVAGLVSLPFSVAVYLVADVRMALLVFIVPAFLSNFYQATTFAQTQSIVNLRMRGVAAAVLLLVINMIGLGLGPPVTGFMSDLLADRFGADSMRYALLSLVLVGVWSTWHYWRAGVHLPADLERADDPN